MGKFTQEELDEVNKTLSTPEDCLKWAFDNLHPKLAKASSFGAEDAAIIDMMFKINSNSGTPEILENQGQAMVKSRNPWKIRDKPW